jgi:phosphatidylserine synthase
VFALPFVVLFSGLLMVSTIRYPHVVNRWLRGRRPIARLMVGLIVVLLMFVAHRYVLGIGCLAYALYGPAMYAYLRIRRQQAQPQR